MALTLDQVQTFWAGSTTLTSLIPAANVWIDVAGDGSTMPYCIVSQVEQKYDYVFNNHYIVKTRFTLTIYVATTDGITETVANTFRYAKITTNGIGCLVEDVKVTGETGGAYTGVITCMLIESF